MIKLHTTVYASVPYYVYSLFSFRVDIFSFVHCCIIFVYIVLIVLFKEALLKINSKYMDIESVELTKN